MHADAPVWVPVAMLTVCAVPIVGAVGPLTKAIMDLAPVDGSAAASSWRNAVWSFGGTVGGVVVTGVAFAVFQSTLTDILTRRTCPPSSRGAGGQCAGRRSGSRVGTEPGSDGPGRA